MGKTVELVKHHPDLECLMIDASHVKVHPHATGAIGGNQAMGRTKGGLNTKIHLAVDASGMPVRFLVTSGTIADSTQISQLIQGIKAKKLLADKGYDTNVVLKALTDAGIEAVIPPKKSRKKQREYDREEYENRYQVEKTFLELKRWREIATRYAKNQSSYVAAVQICCMVKRLNIL